MSSAIVAENLAYTYPSDVNGGGSAVFQNVSFDVEHGETVCLVGPSGCGKSTLLSLLAGFMDPLCGRIHVTRDERGSIGRVGYIFQRDALLPWRTVRGNLLLASELRNEADLKPTYEQISAYLKTFNLDDSVLDRFPAELSGGMRQRVSIVQSLMTDPDILLLDEPFSALDFYTKLKLEAEFRTMVSGTGKAALFVTHDIDEAVAMGDRILVMGASPRGIIDQIVIDFRSNDRLSPEAIRGHSRFGEFFTRVWEQLRDGV